ncbi:heat shock 70 kDa protein 14-B-like [Orbicella faveolata]|uniref:heat shock 70 kDa protein 14-B-like n=1 Tax=Orbicella faveolata TaxID=48498 RepID=UPI0009E51D66|nr:heat shock 70 kDa protein 14-B-like [Orbicella faveolata]
MAAAIGVHLGYTCASLAIYKDGRTEVIANDAGDRVTPVLVACSGKDMSIGLPAKHGLIRNAKNTMARASKIIGLRFSDNAVQEEVQVSDCQIIDKDGEPFFELELNDKKTLFSPKEVVRMIFQKLLEIAQANGGNDIEEAVITIPLHFNDEQRAAIREAAEDAGFDVLRVISQPAAAALAYDIGQSDRATVRTVLVYRLGGTTLDVTVLAVNGGMYRVVSTEHDTTLGGIKFDELLSQHLAAEFQRQWKQDVRGNARAMAKLMAGAENCKHILSSRDTATCAIESLYDGIDMQSTVSRARFESLCFSLFQQSLSAIDRVLATSNVAKDKVDQVILVGGSTRIPRIKQLVQEYFGGKEVCQSIDPDSVLAHGAAIQASLLQGREEQFNNELEVECTSKAISVMLEEAESCLCPIIPKYTPIPSRRTHNFTTSVDNQETVCLCVYEVNDDTPNDPGKTLVAKVVLEDIPPMAKGEAQIIGTFHIRRDGSLHIHLVEKTSEKSVDINIEASG